jgi:hypothetical protein
MRSWMDLFPRRLDGDCRGPEAPAQLAQNDCKGCGYLAPCIHSPKKLHQVLRRRRASLPALHHRHRGRDDARLISQWWVACAGLLQDRQAHRGQRLGLHDAGCEREIAQAHRRRNVARELHRRRHLPRSERSGAPARATARTVGRPQHDHGH